MSLPAGRTEEETEGKKESDSEKQRWKQRGSLGAEQILPKKTEFFIKRFFALDFFSSILYTFKQIHSFDHVYLYLVTVFKLKHFCWGTMWHW